MIFSAIVLGTMIVCALMSDRSEPSIGATLPSPTAIKADEKPRAADSDSIIAERPKNEKKKTKKARSEKTKRAIKLRNPLDEPVTPQ